MNLHAISQLLTRSVRNAFATLLVCGVLAACAAPQNAAQNAGTRAAPAASATPVKIDASCRTSADCTVKNVGNCCGYYPACVNTSSPTDPQGVQAECARSGRMSVCGFREISACQCVRGQCEAASGGLGAQ